MGKNGGLDFKLDRRLCKSCGICMELCAKKVLAPDAEGKPFPANAQACVTCGLCELHCPDFALRISKVNL
ncbi:2-keto acid:ferredoxin oxidoreductase subunit delta [Deltaproteobacteria bacterium]|nr:2-keto acid:ferredoxin oxidoreductase subunit delta [Deltaproteobacteria bacterium]